MDRTHMEGERIALILLGGLLAGLGIYLTVRDKTGVDLDFLKASITCLVYGGKALMLTAHTGKREIHGLFAAGIGVGLGALAWQYAASVGYNAEMTRGSDAIPDFYLSVHIAFVLLVTLFQTWQDHGRILPYEGLFRNAWSNLILSVFPLAFAGLFFGALHLADLLLNLVGIEFLGDLLKEEWFVFPAGGLLYGLTIIYLRDHERFMLLSRRFVLAMARIIGLVLCTAAVVFIIWLPFHGLDTFWNSRVAASTMLAVVIVTGIYANAYVADGAGEAWRDVGSLRKILVTVAVAALPLFAVLGAWAFHIRISEYGLTPDRVFAYPVFGVAFFGAVTYLAQIARYRLDWASNVTSANKAIALVIIVIAIGMQFAPITAYRIATDSQVAAIESDGEIQPDFASLRFRFARPGREAFDDLDGSFDNPELQQAWIRAREANSFWQGKWSPEMRPVELTTDEIENLFELVPGEESLEPEDFATARALLVADARPCVQLQRRKAAAGEGCVLLQRDLNGDGLPELVLIARIKGMISRRTAQSNDAIFDRNLQVASLVTRRRNGSWQVLPMGGYFNMNDDRWQALFADLRAGTVKLEPRRFSNIRVGGKLLKGPDE